MGLIPVRANGFTLIEVVMVIVISGIISAMLAIFIRQPVDTYFDASRRAALTDTADTALRRMSRDIRKALPNSVRSPNTQCIEFIPTKTGGRYRADVTGSGHGDVLDFASADTQFDMFGLNGDLPADQQISPNDVIAVYNLGFAGADAYSGNNTSAVSAVGAGSLANETRITLAAKRFPLESASNRFFVIPGDEKVVSFVCHGGKLFRNSNYAYTLSCPTAGGVQLAQNVNSCQFTYNGTDLQRNALVQMTIQLSKDGETVTLYHEAHVNNTP